MRLSTMILLCGALHVSASATSQNVTITGKDLPLVKVFEDIKQQTGYSFVYDIDDIVRMKRVNLQAKNVPLKEVLDECFRGQLLTWQIVNKTIVVSERPVVADSEPADGRGAPDALSAPTDVTIIVLNAEGQPLVGASVVVKGTKQGTTTNAKGVGSLSGVADGAVLVVSYTGYVSQEVKVGGKPNYLVKLAVSVSPLDEVQMIAYGTTTKRFSTGDITTVTAAEIERQPVMNPLLTLQGLVPGLLVTQTNGFASAPVKLDIRGIGNLAQATDPLYIIDGVPLTVLIGSSYGFSQSAFGGSTTATKGSTRSAAGGQSPLFSMNPNDIESISVLTGADATSIYGSRGANGVILITTKKGKAGLTTFDLNATQGISRVTRYWDMLSTPQYLQMRREALKNDGLSPTIISAPDLLLWDTTRYTNWQKELFGHSGENTKVSAGLSGGNQQTLFRINADYSRVTDITTLSGSTQRMTLGFNIQHNTLDRKFSVSLSTNYAYSNVDLIPISYSVTAAPDAPAIYDKKGNPNWAEWNDNGILNLYTFGSSLISNIEKSNFLTSNLQLKYRPFRGFVMSVNLGYNFANNITNSFTPIVAQNPYLTTTGAANFNSSNNRGWIVEPQMSYHTLLGKGNMDMTFGGTFNNVATGVQSQMGAGYTDDNLLFSINNAPVVTAADVSALYKYGGAFGVIKYNLKSRYIIDLNGRRDGSSRFGPGKQFGNFGSVGAAWIVSEEEWFKNALPSFINFAKFKGGYGILGSDGGVGDYQYLSLWSATTSSSSTAHLPLYGGVQPYQPYNPPNQDFHWATTRNMDGGLEIGLLQNNRIYLEVRYYRNRTSDQLTSNPLPDFTGFNSLYENLHATMQNSGWESAINANLITNKDIKWSAYFNISINRNKLVSFPGLANSPYASTYAIGRSVSTRYVLHYLGVDPLTGQYSFEDHNHDGKIVSSGGLTDDLKNLDTYVAENLAPKYFGGFGTRFSYKNVSVSFNFSYVNQIGQSAFSGQYGQLSKNAPEKVFEDHWRYPGDKTKYPAFSTLANAGATFFTQSDGVYSKNASYIRLNNLSVYYSFPVGLLHKLSVTGCQIYMNAQNVFVITKYDGLDPSTQNFGGMPPAKIITGGIAFKF